MMNRMASFLEREDGQDNIEYGLLAALIAVVLVVVLQGFDSPLRAFYESVLDAVNLAAGT
jgi:Flp pilus assembly pilin Flp